MRIVLVTGNPDVCSFHALPEKQTPTYMKTNSGDKYFQRSSRFWSLLFLGASEAYQIEQLKLEAPKINGLGSK